MTLKLPNAEICDKYISGMSIVKLAEYYHCSTMAISNRLHESNIKMRLTRESEILSLPTDEIVKRYLEGEHTTELAIFYNCNIKTINKRIRDTGVPIRNTRNHSDITRECISISLTGREISEKHKQHLSAANQGISYDEWENYASRKEYCPLFNEECRESNRNKYERCCFLTGLPEEENITSTGRQQKLAVHHVDMDKGQGCNGVKWKLVPICLKWHGKVHNELWEARIIWLLENIY